MRTEARSAQREAHSGSKREAHEVIKPAHHHDNVSKSCSPVRRLPTICPLAGPYELTEHGTSRISVELVSTKR